MVLAAAVDQPVPRDFHQEGPQVGAIGEPPAGVAEAAQDVGPDRLHDVHRVELGPERAAQLAADRHPEIRLVREERAVRPRRRPRR